MTADVVPFPFARRRKFIGNIVRRALELDCAAGAKHISDQSGSVQCCGGAADLRT